MHNLGHNLVNNLVHNVVHYLGHNLVNNLVHNVVNNLVHNLFKSMTYRIRFFPLLKLSFQGIARANFNLKNVAILPGDLAILEVCALGCSLDVFAKNKCFACVFR